MRRDDYRFHGWIICGGLQFGEQPSELGVTQVIISRGFSIQSKDPEWRNVDRPVETSEATDKVWGRADLMVARHGPIVDMAEHGVPFGRRTISSLIPTEKYEIDIEMTQRVIKGKEARGWVDRIAAAVAAQKDAVSGRNRRRRTEQDYSEEIDPEHLVSGLMVSRRRDEA